MTKREWVTVLGGLSIGALVGRAQATTGIRATTLTYPLQIKLHRIVIKDDQLGHFDD